MSGETHSPHEYVSIAAQAAKNIATKGKAMCFMRISHQPGDSEQPHLPLNPAMTPLVSHGEAGKDVHGVGGVRDADIAEVKLQVDIVE